MKKRPSNTFIILAAVVLAASMLAGQLSQEPTGMLSRQRTQTEIVFGQCFESQYDANPYTTTLTNCCRTSISKPGPNNYKWKYNSATIYC